MKAKIKYLNYQRNGVAGEPFYHCLAQITDDVKRDMIITFTAKSDDKEIVWSSCRSVYMGDLSLKWRGDEIAYCLNKELYRLMAENKGTIYDCCTFKHNEQTTQTT
jgi:hypothetical protein